MHILRTRGSLNRLQPRIPKAAAVAIIENPSGGRSTHYSVGAVIVDADGVAWQRDIDNLVDEALQLAPGLTYWWKVGSDDDSLTSNDIPLPAKLMTEWGV